MGNKNKKISKIKGTSRRDALQVCPYFFKVSG